MKPIRFAVAQLNPTVGNYRQNTEKILQAVYEAETRRADILVFPEMALPGYPVWDLANQKSFVEEGRKQLLKIAQASLGKKVAVAVGHIQRDKNSKRLSQNALAWIQNGKITGNYVKRLLPTYDVFLEHVFFQPGTESKVVSWQGHRIGLTICEDIWDEYYSVKPLHDLSQMKADFIINISASPYYRGVSAARRNLLQTQSKKYKLPILYVNQVGEQDDLIFDGRSLFSDSKGNILFSAPAFREGVFYFDWNPAAVSKAIAPTPEENNIGETYEALVFGLRDYCRKNKFKKAVIGLSGGIDSALVAAIATDALGPEAVLGVTMPSRYSSQGSWKDSQDLAKRLGICCVTHPIKKQFELVMKEHRANKLKEQGVRQSSDFINLAVENLQARLRGLELMYISNDESRLVLTTGNKSELAMGYCTLYGDMAGGVSVIGDVFKTDVYRLAEYRNRRGEVIPKAILKKAPSAELRPNQKDQDSLPPYEILDAILYHYIEENLSPQAIEKKLRFLGKKKIDSELIRQVVRQVDHNEYKRRQTPPVLRVTRKAWFGRRMPITNQFEH